MAGAALNGEVRSKLEFVLAPFDEARRENMITWVEHEWKTKPLIDTCVCDGLDKDDRPMEVRYVLGETSPCNSGATIFAMLLDEGLRAVVVFTVERTGEGDAAVTSYNRETIFNPKRTHGACSGDALYADLRDFVQDDRRELVQLLLDKLDDGAPVAGLVQAIESVQPGDPIGET